MLFLPVSDSLITSPYSTLSFVYMQLHVEFITVLILSQTASVGHILYGGYRERCDFMSALLVCTCVSVCACWCEYVWAWHVCVDHGGIPWAICIGPVHLRNCLWVCGVLTMFWTISSNKSQPKLLVSVSLAKWQTVYPPKSSLLRYRQEGRGRQTEGQRNRFLRQIPPQKRNKIK